MSTQYFVYVQFSFVHFHSWPDAPDEYAYLREVHRHQFFVTVQQFVGGSNREIEVNNLQAQLVRFCEKEFGPYPEEATTYSCEQIAEKIVSLYQGDYPTIVTVLEDNLQGGGVVTNDHPAYRPSTD